MGFSTTERNNMFMKALMSGVLDANASAVWYETFTPYSMILDAAQVWAQISSIPAAANLTTARNNASANPTIISDLSAAASAIRLTPVAGTNNSTYVAYTTYNDTSSAVLTNWLLPQLVLQSSGAPSNGYAIQLYDGDPDAGGSVVSTSVGQTGTGENATVGWVFNYARGLLLISSDTIASVSNPYIVGFRYIGQTAGAATSASDVQTSLVADEAIAIGDVVRLALNGEGGFTAGRGVKARANSSNGSEVVGIALSAAAAQGNSFNVGLVGAMNVTFGSAPATNTNGSRVFLSDSAAGRATLTPPTSSGSSVVELGKLKAANGSDATVSILFNPNVIIALN